MLISNKEAILMDDGDKFFR